MTMWCLGRPLEPGGRIIPLALSPARSSEVTTLLFRGPVRSYVDARLRDYLKAAVYNGTTFPRSFKPPLLGGAGIFLILLPFAVTKDVKRQKAVEVWAAAERPGTC